MAKLKLVPKGARATPQPTQLRAKQIMTFNHPDGGEGLMMVAEDGIIYMRTEKGWIAFDMTEAANDNPTL